MLLIPNRIRQIKEEGRREGRKEAFMEAFMEGFRAGRESRKPQPDDEEPASLDLLIAWYNSGGITLDELDAIFAARYGGGRGAD